MYKVTKVDAKGNQYNYGTYSDNVDIYEMIPSNYKFNGLFYEAPNTKTFYIKDNIGE